MKTLEVQWTEHKRATVNVPDTYDPDAHRAELPHLVSQIDSESVIDHGTADVSWSVSTHDPDAQVLVDVDPDTILYTAALVPKDAADAPPLRQWTTPVPRRVILADAVNYLNAKGELLQADATALIYDRYPVIRPGTRPYVAWLLLCPTR
ncbi:hypothetical protein ONA92_26565 [Mycobacteroides salmoniphilum]|uniref:hypothetical protein n=1 Tax=Mycobacteroides salmoniphilum TaxID=404941 RepID=UPI00356AEC5D